MNLYKVKLRVDGEIGVIHVGCNSVSQIEDVLNEKRVRYDVVIETSLVADNLVIMPKEWN